jgi:hypothetical protein
MWRVEGVEEFFAGGVVEEFCVGAFGDGGGGVAEQFADDFESEAVVEEVAGEGSSEGVRRDVGSVVAVSGLRAAGVVWGSGGVACRRTRSSAESSSCRSVVTACEALAASSPAAAVISSSRIPARRCWKPGVPRRR